MIYITYNNIYNTRTYVYTGLNSIIIIIVRQWPSYCPREIDKSFEISRSSYCYYYFTKCA